MFSLAELRAGKVERFFVFAQFGEPRPGESDLHFFRFVFPARARRDRAREWSPMPTSTHFTTCPASAGVVSCTSGGHHHHATGDVPVQRIVGLNPVLCSMCSRAADNKNLSFLSV